MWVVIHFDSKGAVCPDCARGNVDGDGAWVVDYINPSGLGAADAINEFEEADPSIKYYIGRVK